MTVRAVLTEDIRDFEEGVHVKAGEEVEVVGFTQRGGMNLAYWTTLAVVVDSEGRFHEVRLDSLRRIP